MDEFLYLLAEDQKDNAIAIILSGSGKDCASGSKRIHEKGGFVIVQDPNTAVSRSMPLAALQEDHPEEILSSTQLGNALLDLLESRRWPYIMELTRLAFHSSIRIDTNEKDFP